jgi:hypothetical protein
MFKYYVDGEQNGENGWQPQSVLKMLILQTMHSRFFGGKIKNSYCSPWAGVVGFSSCSSLTQEMLPLL